MAFKVVSILVISFLIFFHSSIVGQITLPHIFSDHMVIQRDVPLPVWGTSKGDSEVKVSLNSIHVGTEADAEGNWRVIIPEMNPGGPYSLTFSSAGDTLILKDILIGEVWLCSGQSNMEWPVKNAAEGPETIPLANNHNIRFFQMKKKHDMYASPFSHDQVEDFTNGKFFNRARWEICTPETAAEFSGVGYFFGKRLYDSLQVAIGLIQNSVSGSPAQSWVSKEALASHPQLQHLVDDEQLWINSNIIHPWLVERAEQNWANVEQVENITLPGHPFAPSYLFDSAIKTLAPFAIRGAIWYQGESNATHPQSYPAIMEMLLESWRDLWNQGDFPFYFVQLPKIGNRSLWPEFRDAQQQCLTNLNTGMVVTLDQGHPSDVHPREKEVIGIRLADLALVKTYQRNISAESPILNSYNWQKSEREIILKFNNTYDGLEIKSGDFPKGFYLQGYFKNGTLEAIIEPENITVSNYEIFISYPADFLPVNVKYAWAPYPENNIINSAELPLAPFKIELDGTN